MKKLIRKLWNKALDFVLAAATGLGTIVILMFFITLA